MKIIYCFNSEYLDDYQLYHKAIHLALKAIMSVNSQLFKIQKSIVFST